MDLQILLDDLKQGNNGILYNISDNMEKLLELIALYPDIEYFGNYLQVIFNNINMLQVVNDGLPYLAFNEDSIYKNMDMLRAIYDSLDTLPDDVAAIQEASQRAVDYANQLKELSVAVDDAPYGHVGSGSYNSDTGMLTLNVPQGRPGEQGDGIRIRKIYASVNSMNGDFGNAELEFGNYVMIHTGSVTSSITGDVYIKDETQFRFLYNVRTILSGLDNVASADTLATARNISLVGDVIGSAYFDGSSDISINTTSLSSGGGETVVIPTGSQTQAGILRLALDSELLGTNNNIAATAGQVAGAKEFAATASALASTANTSVTALGTRVTALESAGGSGVTISATGGLTSVSDGLALKLFNSVSVVSTSTSGLITTVDGVITAVASQSSRGSVYVLPYSVLTAEGNVHRDYQVPSATSFQTLFNLVGSNYSTLNIKTNSTNIRVTTLEESMESFETFLDTLLGGNV